LRVEHVAFDEKRKLSQPLERSPSWTTPLARASITRDELALIDIVSFKRGADIRFIQQLLGHPELSTTRIYTRVSIQKLNQVYAATHLARLERACQEAVKTEG
jgi:hypothetical protein